MLRDYPIIDADGHVFEPNAMWENYLASEFKARAPRQHETGESFKNWLISWQPKLEQNIFPGSEILANPIHRLKLTGAQHRNFIHH